MRTKIKQEVVVTTDRVTLKANETLQAVIPKTWLSCHEHHLASKQQHNYIQPFNVC